MKEEILSIASDLREGFMTADEAKEQLLVLFGVSNCCSHEWIKSAVQKNTKFCNKCGKYK